MVLDLQPRTAPVLAPAPGTRLLAPRLQLADEPELSYLHEMMHEQINKHRPHMHRWKSCLKYFA